MKIEGDLFSLIAEKTDLIVVLYREKFLYANRVALELFGYTEKEVKSLHVWDVVHPSYRERVKEMVLRRLSCKEEASRYAELPVKSKDGSYRVIQLNAFSIRVRGSCAGMAIGMDKSREKEFSFLLAQSGEVFNIVDRDGIVRYKSPSVQRVLGWSEGELLNRPFTELIHPQDKGKVLTAIEESFKNPGNIVSVDYRSKKSEGDYIWIKGTIFLPRNWQEIGLEGVVVNEKDITEGKFLKSLLADITHYDPLTGLPNRHLFMDHLRNLIEIAMRRKELLPVMVVDIYRLKEINTAYGLSIGDRVLSEVAKKLKNTLRHGDVVSRFFADRFGVIPTGIRDMESFIKVVNKLNEAFKEPFEVNGNRLLVNINIGVALCPQDGSEPEELVKKAEGALLKAREMGPGTFAFFSEEIDREVSRRLSLMTSLKEAIDRGRIVPYYQPIYNIHELKLVGLEVLARWQHEDGNIPPSDFIPVAESTGLIHDLGRLLLERSISEITSLKRDMHVAMNFSIRQFYQEDLPNILVSLLDKHNFPPKHFWVEITESVAMKEPERTKDILERLRETGVKVAIDDFGTGYSSMNYLIEFEIDKLKIDRSFTLRMKESERAKSVVKTIVDRSNSIGALSLAEGVEDKETLELLRSMGCREAQGFYFAPPMDLNSLREYMERH